MATITADEYREIVKSIINTATGGSAGGSYPWNALNNGSYTAQDFYDLMQTRAVKKAGYDAVLNADGSVRTYTYINKNGKIADLGSYDDIAGAFNSNYQTGTASSGTVQFTQATDTVMTEATETASSAVEAAGTMSKFTNGVKGVGSFVVGKVVPAVAAGMVGARLGKTIDKILYDFSPDFWDSHGMSTLNPDTWDSITGNQGGKDFINAIFGIDKDTGNTTAYIDQNALAYMTYFLSSIGAISSETYLSSNTDEFELNSYNIKFLQSFNAEIMNDGVKYQGNDSNRYFYLLSHTDPVYICSNASSGQNEYYDVYMFSKSPFVIRYVSSSTHDYNSKNSGTVLEHQCYVYYEQSSNKYNNYKIPNYAYSFHNNFLQTINNGVTSYYKFPSVAGNPINDKAVIFIAALYGNGQEITSGGIDGITNQPDATQFDPSTVTDIASALQALKDQFPDLWNNRVENTVVQPDGSTKTYVYVPVPMPTGGTWDQPTTEGAKQSNPEVDPSTATDTLLNTLIQILTQTIPAGMTDTPPDPINPNPPDTGGGDTPVVVPPTGSANALYSIYNPSQAQLNSFGAWLWSSNFVDQLLKLFNDPMQAIIGLHKVFATPPISGSGTIKVGYLDSGVSSNIVGNQYTTVDCGSINLYEYYGNVFDYDPFTKVNLYLPFIGIVPLNVGEIMRSTIRIIYHVDVLTGACLAEVKINRDSAGGTLFQYSGNAAVQYPISSGSYMSIISGIMSLAGGVAGTIATGGAAMPVLLGAGASVGRMHTDISHSGSFSGNAGAMGIKKPYLIIDRPQTALAKNFPNYIGYPSNFTATIGSCNGFVKVLECHLENINATKSELEEIDSTLKEGVII